MTARLFRFFPARLFRALRMTPVVGTGLLRAIDALFPRHALVTRRIRRGPLRGMVLEIDPRALDMVVGRYEQTVENVIESDLRAGAVAYDVGANIGYFSLLMASKVGRSGVVVSFEPNPPTLEALKRNARRNSRHIGQVVTIAAAVGSAPGITEFRREQRHTRARMVSSGGDLEVPLTTVDAATEKFGVPDLMKIDVEGAEVDVLLGATRVLDLVPLVVIEVHSPELEHRCRRLLERIGFDVTVSAIRGKEECYLVARRPHAPTS